MSLSNIFPSGIPCLKMAGFIGDFEECRLLRCIYLAFLRRGRQLLVTADVPISPTPITLMIEALRSSETSVLRRTTRRNILEDGVLHSHCRENQKSYIALTGWAL
jgi:hypothetical protein